MLRFLPGLLLLLNAVADYSFSTLNYYFVYNLVIYYLLELEALRFDKAGFGDIWVGLCARASFADITIFSFFTIKTTNYLALSNS